MSSRVLQLILELQDKATKNLQSTFGDWEKMSQQTGKFFTVAGGAITGAFTLAVKSAYEAETAVARLTKITQNSVDASEDQIQALIEQAVALEKIGVVSAGATMAAQGTLSTFDLQTESIQKLIPSFLDMIVAEKGVNVTTDDMIGMANGLGKVLQGQVGALSKQGFVFDAATEKILKYGTETEKVEALVGILDSTYKDLNVTMAETPEGKLANLQNQFAAFSEQIGGIFIPILDDLMGKVKGVMDRIEEWAAKNPELFEKIVKITAVVGLLMLALGPLLIVLPGIVLAVQGLAAVFVLLMGPVGLVIAIIAILVASFLYVRKNWDDVVWGFDQGIAFLKGLWSSFSTWIMDILTTIGDFFTNTWNSISETTTFVWEAISGFFVSIWERIKNTISGGLNWIVTLFKTMTAPINAAWSAVWSGIGNTLTTVFEGIKTFILATVNWIIGKVNGLIEKINSVIRKGAEALGIEAKTISTIQLIGDDNKSGGASGSWDAVVPNSKAAVGQTINVTNNIGGSVLTENELSANIQTSIMDGLRLNQRITI